MKKRFLAVILSLCLLLALVPVQANAIGGVLSPAERYTEYLVNGGYNTVMDRTIEKEDVGIQSVLIDLDDDNIQEALVWVSDLSTMGVRGCMTTCAVLDVENDEVVIRLTAFTGGGSMGGDYLNVKYDNQLEKYIIMFSSVIRDGIDAAGSLYRLYDDEFQISKELGSYYYYVDAVSYQEKIAQIKSETSFYKIEDGNFYYWTIDGRYVSETEYDALYDRYTYPEKDSPYTMYEGTYNVPIKIKTVPEGYEFDEDSLNFENYTVSKISKKYFTTMFEDATGKLLYKKYKELGDEGVCYGMSFVTASIYNNLPTITNFVNEKLIGEDEVCQNIRDLETSSKFTVNGEKLSLADYIKYAHLYQLSSAACQEEIDNWGDRDGLAEMIQQYLDEDLVGLSIALYHFEVLEDGTLREDEDGNPVATGHQVLAIGIEGNDILIDDPNNTSDDFERLTLNDDGSWKYSGAWTSDGVNSDNSIFTYETCVEDPYMLLVTGTDTTPGVNVDEDETHVRGMSRVDADKVLVWVDSAEYSLNQNQVIPLNFKSGLGDKTSNLYWVKSGSSVTVSDLSGENSAVYLAGNDDLLSVAAGEGSKVTMTVSDSYTGLILKSEAGETCTLSLENTNSDEEDVVITVSGTVTDGTVLMAKDESGIDYSGMSDVTVTLTKGEEDELSQVVTEEGTSIYVDYAADDAVFEMHIGANDSPVNPFVDVAPGKFYETPVLWAVENEITNGMDDTHFAPDNNCNRGQVVTFLWRAAGSPEPTSTNNPFTDVKEGKFYYKAVLWAVENGITNGTSATTFSPNDNCTRGQVATFLWRTLNEPAASSSANPFTDVAQGKFYYDAVLWAVDAGVTNGMTTTTFAPNNACTRGQIVTFLYRALG